MDLRITRKTGFYGMGSPFSLLINGKKQGGISQGQTKEIPLSDTNTQGEIVVKFSLLQSQPYPYDINKPDSLDLEVVFNPSFVLIYIGLFLALITAMQSVGFLIVGLASYVVFLVFMSRRALVIRPVTN